jgi:hypothetical protein
MSCRIAAPPGNSKFISFVHHPLQESDTDADPDAWSSIAIFLTA